jgi:hypothetical protein
MTLHWRRPPRHQPPPIINVRIPELEILVAVIADLAVATADLTAAVTSAVDVLTTPPTTGDTTVLSAADQATLDTAVAAVQEATANLTAVLPVVTGDGSGETLPPVDGGDTGTDQPAI